MLSYYSITFMAVSISLANVTAARTATQRELRSASGEHDTVVFPYNKQTTRTK